MKILHYALGFPPYRSGGLTGYVTDLAAEQIRQGDQVQLMWPGRMTTGGKVRFIRKQNTGTLPDSIEMANPLPVPLLEGVRDISAYRKPCGQDPFLRFLKEDKPDVIHIHTFMGLYREFLEAAKKLGIRTVFTTHDYYPICPKASLICHGRECEGGMEDKGCSACDMTPLPLKKIAMMQSPLYRALKDSALVRGLRKNYKLKQQEDAAGADRKGEAETGEARPYHLLRQYYADMLGLIDLVHCNSTTAKERYQELAGIENTIVLPISNHKVVDKRAKKEYNRQDKLHITYMGPATVNKGFFLLLNALDLLCAEAGEQFELHVYVPAAETRSYLQVHPRFAEQELDEVLRDTDVLAVPSVWRETFGFVALEGLSRGVPVIVTENVGAKDLISHGQNGYVLKPDAKELKEAIKELIFHRERLQGMNDTILKADFPYTMERHAREAKEKLYR